MARSRKRPPLGRLRLRMMVEHPSWSDARLQAELIRAQLGQGPYAKAVELLG